MRVTRAIVTGSAIALNMITMGILGVSIASASTTETAAGPNDMGYNKVMPHDMGYNSVAPDDMGYN